MTLNGTPATRDRLIDATVALVRAKGAAATGTKEILDRAAAPRGSFYFHFPEGKNQLVLEAMRRAGAATLGALEAALANEKDDLGPQISSVFEAIAADLEDNDYGPGCAVAVTTMESASNSAIFQQAVAEVFSTWTAAIVDALLGRGVEHEQAARFADALVAAMEGATLLARAQRDTRPLHNAAAVLLLSIPLVTSDADRPRARRRR